MGKAILLLALPSGRQRVQAMPDQNLNFTQASSSNRRDRGGKRDKPPPLEKVNDRHRKKRRNKVNELKASHDLNPNDMATMRKLCHGNSGENRSFCVARPACHTKHHWLPGGNSCPQLTDVKLSVWKNKGNETLHPRVDSALKKSNLAHGSTSLHNRKARLA